MSPIVALGVTFPFDEVPQDARIWRVHSDGQLEWIDTRPVAGDLAGGALVFARPGGDGSASADWPGGEYRIDVLVGDFIGRVDVKVPGRLGTVPGPDAWPAPPGDLVAAKTIDPSVTGQGPFAVVDGVSVELPATAGPTLDEEGEWWAELRQSGDQTPNVAVARLPRATGLGVMFTEHAVVSTATIRRLAPEGLDDPAPAFGGVSSLHGRTPFLVFTPTGGAAWTPGVYAISTAWTDPPASTTGPGTSSCGRARRPAGPAAETGSDTGG